MDIVVSVYNAIAKQYADEFCTPSDYLEDFLALLPQGASIIDVGCGPGVELAYCQSKGFVAEGIDLSEEMVKLAREKNPNTPVSLADVLTFTLRTKAKACIASYSLIHLPKDTISTALRNIRYNLEENAHLFIAIHEGESCETVVVEPFDPKLKTFLRIYSQKEFASYLEGAGFQVTKMISRQAISTEEFSYNKLILFAKTISS